MGYRETYEEWLNNPYFDDETKAELKAIEGDDKEIEDRFYMDLEFGTAGLRGVIGAGTNRMNVYTVRKATQGLANYICNVNAQAKGVAIAYDSRQRESISQPAITHRNIMATRYTGRTVHRLHHLTIPASWMK